jgi:beta-mannosidase
MRVTRESITDGFSLELVTPSGSAQFAATVPGSIHTDLIAAGVIGDIRTTGSEVEQEWIRNTDSTYRVNIPVHESATTSEFSFSILSKNARNADRGCSPTNLPRSDFIEISPIRIRLPDWPKSTTSVMG